MEKQQIFTSFFIACVKKLNSLPLYLYFIFIIMFMNYLCRFILIFMGLFFISCSSKKYISEIPYRYSSQETLKSINSEKDFAQNKFSTIDDNEDKLSDEQLRLKEKYSIIFGVMPKEIKNYDFYAYIEDWVGTPYQRQSLELQKGVDCSYFVQALYSDVFKETLSKTPDGIFRSKAIQLFTGRSFLKEGDILFFRYDKFKPISDVAIYLHNDRILACSRRELNIYNFNDEYFQKRYVAAGRLKNKEK